MRRESDHFGASWWPWSRSRCGPAWGSGDDGSDFPEIGPSALSPLPRASFALCPAVAFVRRRFFAAKIAGVVRHSSCPAAWREEARLGGGHAGPLRVPLIRLCTWPSISFKPLPPEVSSEESVHRRTAAIYFPDFSSYGAPVPEEPRNSFRPSGSVTSRPLALFDPSLDR